jgi:uncharacterized protein (DUF362 family)
MTKTRELSPVRSIVATTCTSGGLSVPSSVRACMEAADWRRFISPGADVCLKPNLGWDRFLPGAVTSPWVVEGVVQTIRDYVGKIYVVEADQVLVNCERALRQTRIDRVIERYGLEWVNLSKGEFVEVEVPGARALAKIRLPEILLRTEIITIPVMKTHNKTTITGALKNQWGCLPKDRHRYHGEVHAVIADLNRALRPRLAVMDATVCLEGNGPKSGRPRIMDLVLASGDLVALDAVAAMLMGLDPARIEHLRECAEAGLGTLDRAQMQIVGPDPDSLAVAFQPAHDNIVSRVEMALRHWRYARCVFGTCVFDACCYGANGWYWVWYYLGPGKRRRDRVLWDPRYGPQWR